MCAIMALQLTSASTISCHVNMQTKQRLERLLEYRNRHRSIGPANAQGSNNEPGGLLLLCNTNLKTVIAIAVVLFFLAIVSAFASKKKDTAVSQETIPAVSKMDQPIPDDTDTPQEIVVKLETNAPFGQQDDNSDSDLTSQDDPSQDTMDSSIGIDSIVRERATICSLARNFLGTPYRWGGTTPNAFDCSGFTRYVYAKVGIRLPRTAREQFKAGKKVTPGKWTSGDLVFFDMNKGYVSHVGMYLGASCFIHASNPRTGVKIDSLTERSYKPHYVGARRYAFT